MVTHDDELAKQASRNIHVKDGKVSELKAVEPDPKQSATA
jgi:ABC-type lipoprotein export system ATPase subunit